MGPLGLVFSVMTGALGVAGIVATALFVRWIDRPAD